MAALLYVNTGFGQCSLGCKASPTNVALGETGELQLEPIFFLEFRSSGCTGSDTIEILGIGGDVVDCSMVGNSYTVKITNVESGNSCESIIHVQDNIEPEITIPDDITVQCTDDYKDLNLTGTAIGSDNCTANTNHVDDVSYLNQCGFGEVLRNWTVTDLAGHSATGVQKILIVDTVAPSIDYPSDITIHCGTDPEDLSITGSPVYSDDCGSLDDSYRDIPYAACGGNTKRLIREWFITDFCDPNGPFGSFTHRQTIYINDTIAPSFSSIQDDTIKTLDLENYAEYLIPLVPNLMDNCSNVIVDTLVISSVGDTLLASDGLYALPMHSNEVQLFISDSCGNRDSLFYNVNVKDQSDPMMICSGAINLSLSSDETKIAPSDFVLDYSDNVSADENLSLSINHFGVFEDTLALNCTSVSGDYQSVLVRVTDESGNFNQCQSYFILTDGFAPRIICPSDLTIDCHDDLDSLNTPTVTENCRYSYWFEDDFSALNNCGLGELHRKWVVEDESGLRDSCIQFIEIIRFNPPQFTLVQDTTIQCGQSTDPYFTGQPIFSNECSQLIYSYTDKSFTGPPGVVELIQRTFEIYDDCDPAFYDSFVQKITVEDRTSPELEIDQDSIYYVGHGTCQVQVEIPLGIQDSCGQDVDLSHTLGYGSIINGVYQGLFDLGTYRFQVIAEDEFGNSSDEWVEFLVKDSISPQAACNSGISIDIGDDFRAYPDPILFNANSNDNCTDLSDLEFSVFPSEFNCSELGLQNIRFTVTDASGNTAHCYTNVLITDNDFTCPISEFSVSGEVLDPEFYPIANLEIWAVNNTETRKTRTDAEGKYIFEELPSGTDWQIFPSSDLHIRDGVSTLDLILFRQHLLELREFDQATQYLAADMNRNGRLSNLDLIFARGLILRTIDTVVNSKVLRSFPLSTEFNSPEQALSLTDSMEKINLIGLDDNFEAQNFMVQKAGDIDNSLFAGQSEFRQACDSTFYFETTSVLVEEGDRMIVKLKAGRDVSIMGIEFVKKYDLEFLNFEGFIDVMDLGLRQGSNFNHIESEGLIIVSWDTNPALEINEGETILEMVFSARKPFVWPNYCVIEESQMVDNNNMTYEICDSDITSSDELDRKINVRIFPNPVQDILKLEGLSRLNLNNLELELHNTIGNQSIKYKLDISQKEIDVSRLLPGSYILSLRNMSGEIIFSKMFVKNQ